MPVRARHKSPVSTHAWKVGKGRKKKLEKKKNWKLAEAIDTLADCKSAPRRILPHTKGHSISSMTMDVVKSNKAEDEYTIKPQAVTPAVDTSSWPLLLKNYDKRESSKREAH